MVPSGRVGFSHLHRLKRPADFQHVFTTSCRSKDSRFVVLAIDRTSENPRLGIIVPKKIVRLAVDRNRIKRVIRESFRTNLEMLEGLDVVVLVRTGIVNTDNNTMYSALANHWQKVTQCKK